MMRRILKREELIELAAELGVRPDWHEPDEQEVYATTQGNNFDNAGFWPAEYKAGRTVEKHVIIYKAGQVIAAVNLATLLAWASEKGYEEP